MTTRGPLSMPTGIHTADEIMAHITKVVATPAQPAPAFSPDAELKVGIEGSRLVISIGTDLLLHALEHGMADRGYGGKVVDKAVFLREVVDELNREDGENGLTRVQVLLDDAADEAINQGAAGWRSFDEDD